MGVCRVEEFNKSPDKNANTAQRRAVQPATTSTPISGLYPQQGGGIRDWEEIKGTDDQWPHSGCVKCL